VPSCPRLFFLGVLVAAVIAPALSQAPDASRPFRIGEEGYYTADGINVMLFDDFYPEGHQGGLTIVQRGTRVAANGDLRLEPAPGQWSPVPVIGPRRIDRERGTIAVDLWYPDSTKDRRGFNPILYPDVRLAYTVTTATEGGSIRVTVDLAEPLPRAWEGRIGFNLELFPGAFFGEHYLMDGTPGVFPRQVHGPMIGDSATGLLSAPLAMGKEFVVCPQQAGRHLRVSSRREPLELIDGRGVHNNGWFILRSAIAAGATRRAIEWILTPRNDQGWWTQPVIQVSQVGYHPLQPKIAVVELDRADTATAPVLLLRVAADSTVIVRADSTPVRWGRFLRSQYLRFDFTDVRAEGLYRVRCGSAESGTFEIRKDLFARHVWQPTLEYFLPIQMCHMLVRDRYKVWHGLCHADDARMAPPDHNHFDGYLQGASTLTRFRAGEHVPGLNAGGWHDAGDYDLRLESQAETVYKLALAYEWMRDDYDVTTVDQGSHTVQLHLPDGTPDILQQVEHGALTIVGAEESLGRPYRGIIEPTLTQYVHLGDAATATDNLPFVAGGLDPILGRALPQDDRWVFTEVHPERELLAARSLAAASRVLRRLRPSLAARCLRSAEAIAARNADARVLDRCLTAAELLLTRPREADRRFVLDHREVMTGNIERCSEVMGRLVRVLQDQSFTDSARAAAARWALEVARTRMENPYNVPYRPHIWGAGWGIQALGVHQLLLHEAFPTAVPIDGAWHALAFVLGCHPGDNVASFVSGVGARSVTAAYGPNRDEWSFLPGGVVSGTALVRPDLPELKVWPYFWQQTEYVLGGGTVDFLILGMAADRLLNR
jgi:hypothetical protein